MFYSMYLSGLCERRHWPDPLYEPYRTRNGHHCKVRVNNREYATDVPYESEALAKDGAATKAYMICRNFSVNDGMFPGQRPGGQGSSGGIVQGLPVAIGSGRRSSAQVSFHTTTTGYDTERSSTSDGTSSGGDSPRSTDSAFEQQFRAQHHQRTERKVHHQSNSICYCKRAVVRAHGRCDWCLREAGWA